MSFFRMLRICSDLAQNVVEIVLLSLHDLLSLAQSFTIFIRANLSVLLLLLFFFLLLT